MRPGHTLCAGHYGTAASFASTGTGRHEGVFGADAEGSVGQSRNARNNSLGQRLKELLPWLICQLDA
jgi:hypothetical protein